MSGFLKAPDRFHWRPEIYQLERCEGCSYVWLVGPPTLKEMPFHYGKDYHRGVTAAGEAPGRWERHRRVILQLKQGGMLLDIGCSSGGFLSTMMGSSWTLFGIEMEASTAIQARAKTDADISIGDVLNAPFASASFDVITCFDVLEHVYDPRAFLERVVDWLKPGGVFFTILPNIDSWESRLFRSYWYGLELPRHISHFSPRSLRHLMTSVGLREISIKTWPTTYVEQSLDYLRSALLQKLGISPSPSANEGQRGIPQRAMRKLLRVCLMNPSGRIAAAVGEGASMEAILTK